MPDAPLQLDLSSLADTVVDLSQFMGLWSINETHAMQLLQHVQRLNFADHLARHAGDRIDKLESRIVAAESISTQSRGGSIALISIEGTMTKRGSSFSTSGSTVRARQEIRRATADPDIVGILLRLDTPGGTVSGTHDLAMDVRKANEAKPVYGFIEDLGASAGYRVIVECEQVFANEPSALVGSIGTLMGLYDFSAWATEQGIKPVVIKSGDLKGTGFEGMPVTDEQKAYLQNLVDDHQTEFNAAVSRGRNKPLETVASQWATGRVWPANEALKMGLIDGIQSLDATLAALAERSNKRSSGRKAAAPLTTERTMSENTAPEALTIDQIMAECAGFSTEGERAGDDARFAMDHLKRKSSVETVRKSWMETLNARVGAREQELKAANEKSQSNTKTIPGVEALATTTSSGSNAGGDGSAAEEFWGAVSAQQKLGLSRSAAISKVVAKDPQLHQRFLQEHNEKHRRA